MNRKEAARIVKMLDVIQAYANGAEVQYRPYSSQHWLDTDDPSFSGNFDQYRIKPEPMRLVTVVHTPPGTKHALLCTDMQVPAGRVLEPGSTIEFIEVLK